MYQRYILKSIKEAHMDRCRLQELRRKEVINQRNGYRIGFVDDLEVNTNNAEVCSLIIYGRVRFFGFFGRDDDCIIPWQNIKLIGQDTILVDFCYSGDKKRRKKPFFGREN